MNATARRAWRVRRSARGRGGRRALERLAADARAGDAAAIEAVAALVREGAATSRELWRTAVGDAHGAWWRGPIAEALWDTGVPAPQVVIDGAWRLWLADGSRTDLRDRLLSCGRPAVDDARGASVIALGHGARTHDLPWVRSALLACAAREDHPIGDTARAVILAARHDTGLVDEVCARAAEPGGAALAAFCLDHGLVPADPVRRAAFYVLVGQGEQYRALDPDGSLLGTAYAAAGPAERGRLRAAMAAGGDYDVLRVIARDRRALPDGEGRYLAERLATRRDWPALWDLLPRLPLPVALGEVHRLGDWRPADGDQRELLDLLLRTAEDTAFVEAVARRWGGPPPPAVPASHLPFGTVAVSADGARLALAKHRTRGERSPVDSFHEYDVAGGKFTAMVIVGGVVERMLLCGPVTLLRVRRKNGTELHLWDGEKAVTEPDRSDEVTSGPYAVRGGYVVGVSDARLRFTRLGDGGHRYLSVPGALGEAGHPAGQGPPARLLGADPDGTRAAVWWNGRIVVLDAADGTVLAVSAPGAQAGEVAFAGPGLLASFTRRRGGGTLLTWRYTSPPPGGRPAPLAATGDFADHDGATGMHAVPPFGLVAVQRADGVAFHDLPTLEPASFPPVCGLTPQAVWANPHGTALAVSNRPPGSYGALVRVVTPPWEHLPRIPPAALTPADLDAVERALRHLDGDAGRALALTRAVLLAGTANDISLGRVHHGPPATDDIAL